MELMRFSGYTHVDVEPNDNTPMMAQQVYKNIGVPFPVSHVRIYGRGAGGTAVRGHGLDVHAGRPRDARLRRADRRFQRRGGVPGVRG